jgi:hypothetical protein
MFILRYHAPAGDMYFRAKITHSRGHINSRSCVFLIARIVVWCPFDFNTAVSFHSAQNDLFARAYKFAQLCLFVLLFGVILHVGCFTALVVISFVFNRMFTCG